MLGWVSIQFPFAKAQNFQGTHVKIRGGCWLGGGKLPGSDIGHEDCHWREWRTTSFSGTGDETGWCGDGGWFFVDRFWLKLLGMIIQWIYIYIYMWILDRYCEWFKKHDDNFFQGSSWISGSSWLVVNGFIAWLSITFIDSKGPPIIKATLLTTGDLSENSSREESADLAEYGQVNGSSLHSVQ